MMHIDEILEYLPHRYPPFLLVDRVTEVEKGKSIKGGYKNVSFNEPFFYRSLSGQSDYAGCPYY